MVYVLLHTNSSSTADLFPFLEIVHTIEVVFNLTFCALFPVASYMLWNARPFHRNLRLSLCNLTVQGLFGNVARIILLYNHYAGEGPLDSRISVIIASLLRTVMFESFVGVPSFFLSAERAVTTFAWSWYEKASPSTLIIFVVLDTSSIAYAVWWSYALVFEIITMPQYIMVLAYTGIFGALFLRAYQKLQHGARVNQNSVARKFQIRENVIIIKALLKVVIRVVLLNVPLFVLAVCQFFLFQENETNAIIFHAFFDLIVSLYPTILISYFPFSDVIFEKSLKRMRYGTNIFNLFAMIPWNTRKKVQNTVVANESDHYFSMLLPLRMAYTPISDAIFNKCLKQLPAQFSKYIIPFRLSLPLERPYEIAPNYYITASHSFPRNDLIYHLDFKLSFVAVLSMVHVILHINRTFTDPFYPLFEIVYTGELRLSLCNLVVQGLLGTTARLIFVYNQYFGDTPFEQRFSVIIASILRSTMLEAFVGVFIFFSIERAIATFAWSWYEKESAYTFVAFVLLEGCAQLWSWCWSIALTFEYITTKTLMIGIASTALVGITIGLFVIAVNFRATMKMKKVGARVNKYSVAKTYQIRENVIILKALFKMAVSVMILNVPLFVIGYLSIFSSNANERMICRAGMDLIISIYPAVIISFIPLSDVIFERSLKRMSFGNCLFRAFSVLHCRCLWKAQKVEEPVTESDHYFSMLATTLQGPATQ